MVVTQDAPKFRPVTIRVETQDELDMLHAVIGAVADNRIQHTQQVIRAAVDLRIMLNRLDDV